MAKTNPLENLVGKTIKTIGVTHECASDSCSYACMVIEFTDGSSWNARFVPRPLVASIFFKSDADDDEEQEIELIHPHEEGK